MKAITVECVVCASAYTWDSATRIFSSACDCGLGETLNANTNIKVRVKLAPPPEDD